MPTAPSPKMLPPTPPTPLTRVRLVRHWLGLTQRQFAALLGCSQPHVAQLETGTAKPSPRLKARLIRLVVPRLGTLLFEPGARHRKEDIDDH